MDSLACVTRTVEETESLGTHLAALLPPGAVVALHGDLATGKTCLTRGMARHFAGNTPVHSPTFTLVNEYGKDRILYHLDLYRLGSAEELLTLGDRRIDVFLEHGGGDTRRLCFENHCLDAERWEAFAQELRRMGLL